MQIIKHGLKIQHIVRGTCMHCGCVIDVNTKKDKRKIKNIASLPDDFYPAVKCPECSEWLYLQIPPLAKSFYESGR